jgi:hypothetical protein
MHEGASGQRGRLRAAVGGLSKLPRGAAGVERRAAGLRPSLGTESIGTSIAFSSVDSTHFGGENPRSTLP